jgi:hypothetical protein
MENQTKDLVFCDKPSSCGINAIAFVASMLDIKLDVESIKYNPRYGISKNEMIRHCDNIFGLEAIKAYDNLSDSSHRVRERIIFELRKRNYVILEITIGNLYRHWIVLYNLIGDDCQIYNLISHKTTSEDINAIILRSLRSQMFAVIIKSLNDR